MYFCNGCQTEYPDKDEHVREHLRLLQQQELDEGDGE